MFSSLLQFENLDFLNIGHRNSFWLQQELKKWLCPSDATHLILLPFLLRIASGHCQLFPLSCDHYCQAGQRGPGGCEHHGGPAAVSAQGRGSVPALGPGPGTHGGQRAQCESHDLGRGDTDIRIQHPAVLQPVTGTQIEKS